MQFFDLHQQFNLDKILVPRKTLDELSHQEWFLAKIRIEHDCISDSNQLKGQAIIQSSENIQIELEWVILDTGHELAILFQGIETQTIEETMIVIKGAQIIQDHESCQPISVQLLSLWIDGTLLPLLPNIRREIKARLNLWDYAEYSD